MSKRWAGYSNFEFKINGYRPEDLPYHIFEKTIVDLGNLFGGKSELRFRSVTPGSACLHIAVPQSQIYVSQIRIEEAKHGTGDRDAVRAYHNLKSTFEKKPNVSATLFDHKRMEVLVFRASPQSSNIQGTVTLNESVKVRGQIVRLGGQSDLASVHLEDVDGFVYIGELKRELAKELAKHLYGPPVELSGQGRWERDTEHWKLRTFRVERFTALDDVDVKVALLRMGTAMLEAGMTPEMFEHVAGLQNEE